MEYYITSSDIKENIGAAELFERIKKITQNRNGYCYYKYPVAGGSDIHLPDIVVVDTEYGVTVFDVLSNLTIEKLQAIKNGEWIIDNQAFDSPILKLEDYQINLFSKYQKYRQLRDKIRINIFIVLPLISQKEFIKKFPDYTFLLNKIIFDDYLEKNYDDFWNEKTRLIDKTDIRVFISVTQGAGRLNDYKRLIEGATSDKIGEAIKLIDTKIALLDKYQHAAAIQIPDGPQRIRGMAGTGKTIILTMKAAYLHSRYPDKKVLYTFNTQSLYNQIKNWITKFYRESEEKDPNWENLLVLHSWGGRVREGVYYRTCLRNSVKPLTFNEATIYDNENPFRHACQELLKREVLEEYDYILMDESQDFPASFFQLIYKLTKEPKRIIFAYDELQSLNNVQIPDTGELFGYNEDGTKKVDFSKGTYEQGIEMDYVLQKSYRNPLEVLMTAHSVGLGIYNTDGYMQVIDNTNTWKAIGYDVIKGEFKEIGEEIIIERPKENSVSFANELYTGNVKNLICQVFKERIDEIAWLADQIENDVVNENVKLQDIVVISLDSKILHTFSLLQKLLFKKNIPSIIPGIGGIERDKFAEEGFVTLSTVYKAKGNEAFIVYVTNFDYLYDYVDFVGARNRAFTALSRAKGWCRITGIGEKMKRALNEIKNTQEKIPQFVFKFPDPNKIARKLSQEEHAKRLQERKKGKKAIKDLLSIQPEAITLTKDEVEALKRKLGLK